MVSMGAFTPEFSRPMELLFGTAVGDLTLGTVLEEDLFSSFDLEAG